MAISGWMGKENVVYTQNGILFSYQKEESPIICYMGETGGHCADEIRQTQRHKHCTVLLTYGI